jgi:hypothetical protein
VIDTSPSLSINVNVIGENNSSILAVRAPFPRNWTSMEIGKRDDAFVSLNKTPETSRFGQF